MDEATIRIWARAAVTACAILVFGPAACTAVRYHETRLLVEKGLDPIAAACAIQGDIATTPMCVLKAAGK